MTAAASGQISATGQQFHGFEVNFFISAGGRLHRLAGFGKSRRVKNDIIIVMAFLFCQFCEQIKNIFTDTPARFIGEALGATVTWDGNAKKAVFEKSETTLVLFIGKREYEVNGQKKQMDTEALLIEGRTFVPARYVAEAFGATVSWNAAIKTVYIDMDKTGKVENEGDTREVAGFIVPKGIDLAVAEEKQDSSSYEVTFTISFLRKMLKSRKMTWKKYYYKDLMRRR